MQVITSSTLTVLHDGQFCVGICEHAESGRYGACRVVFGATEPTDTEILAFVCARWATLPFDYADGTTLPRHCGRQPPRSPTRTPSAASAKRASRWRAWASAPRRSRP